MRTLSANIAVEIPEAPVGETLYRILFLCAVLLFLLTFLLNTAAELVRSSLRKRSAGSRARSQRKELLETGRAARLGDWWRTGRHHPHDRHAVGGGVDARAGCVLAARRGGIVLTDGDKTLGIPIQSQVNTDTKVAQPPVQDRQP